jgi:hypothetical protein
MSWESGGYSQDHSNLEHPMRDRVRKKKGLWNRPAFSFLYTILMEPDKYSNTWTSSPALFLSCVPQTSIMSAAATTASPSLYLLSSGYINSDLATNTTADPVPPLSNPPDSMVKSISSLSSTNLVATDVHLEAPLKQEANKQTDKKPYRSSRLSTVTTICHPACLDHASNSPPFCTPTFSVLFKDNSKEQEQESPYTLSILDPSASFGIIQKLRHSFHLPQSPPSFTIPSFLDLSALWLALYFVLNLSLTLYNKSVLIHFPFPYTLTALHALCGTLGASILLRLQGPGPGATGTTRKSPWSFSYKVTPDLSAGEIIVLLLFSMLYTTNIVVSNASLRLVTVPVRYLYWFPGTMLTCWISFTVSSSCARIHTFLHNRVFFGSPW